MGNSGNTWVDAIFDWAVYRLDDLGTALGMSYELVNIVVFLGIGPALVGFLIGWVLLLRRANKKMLQECRKVLGNNAW
jgi:hypothetical protein